MKLVREVKIGKALESNVCDTGPNMCDNKHDMVIVTHIWQKLNTVEREVTRLVIDYWQLFSHIIGETLLIVTHYWRNPTLSAPSKRYVLACSATSSDRCE